MNLSNSLPDDLPWDGQQAFVLLDGANCTALPERLKQLDPTAHSIALYDQPPFSELRDISPLLVTVQPPDGAILQFYLQQAHEEWGVLLFSRQSAHEVARHLRKLLIVELPEGSSVVLRLADAAVAQALFASAEQCLFGPLTCVVTADSISGCWQRHQPRRPECPELVTPYRLSKALNAALDEVDRRRALLDLDAHLLTFFPAHHQGASIAQRWPALERLAADANALGLGSQSEFLYYANLMAWLDGTEPAPHSAIAHLLHSPSLQPAGERVALAAELACDAAMKRKSS